MKILNQTFNIVKDIKTLASVFVDRSGAWADLNTKFRNEYLPSAFAHYYETGNIGAINNVLQAVNNGRGLAKFRPLLRKLSAHKFDESKGRFSGKKDKKVFDRMLKINKDHNAPQFIVAIAEFLEREEQRNESAKRSFNEEMLAAVRTIHRLSTKEDVDASALAPIVDGANAIMESLEPVVAAEREEKKAA